MSLFKPPYTPSPEEIEQRATEVRRGWDLEMRRKRAGKGASPPPEIQVVDMSEWGAAVIDLDRVI